jgi:hypothetical protein
MYSQEDIEKKRLQALQRKNQRVLFDNNVNKKATVTSKNATSNQLLQNKTVNSIDRISNNFTNKYKNTNLVPNSNKFSTHINYRGKSQSSIKLQSMKNRFHPVANTTNFYGVQQVQEVQCFMISDNRFNVDMSVFDTNLVDLFKTIPSRLYSKY